MKRASTVFTKKKRTGAKLEEASLASKVPPPDGEELVESCPPMHAIGEHANRLHVGALVVDEAAREDQLGGMWPYASDPVFRTTNVERWIPDHPLHCRMCSPLVQCRTCVTQGAAVAGFPLPVHVVTPTELHDERTSGTSTRRTDLTTVAWISSRSEQSGD